MVSAASFVLRYIHFIPEMSTFQMSVFIVLLTVIIVVSWYEMMRQYTKSKSMRKIVQIIMFYINKATYEITHELKIWYED